MSVVENNTHLSEYDQELKYHFELVDYYYLKSVEAEKEVSLMLKKSNEHLATYFRLKDSGNPRRLNA